MRRWEAMRPGNSCGIRLRHSAKNACARLIQTPTICREPRFSVGISGWLTGSRFFLLPRLPMNQITVAIAVSSPFTVAGQRRFYRTFQLSRPGPGTRNVNLSSGKTISLKKCLHAPASVRTASRGTGMDIPQDRPLGQEKNGGTTI